MEDPRVRMTPVQMLRALLALLAGLLVLVLVTDGASISAARRARPAARAATEAETAMVARAMTPLLALDAWGVGRGCQIVLGIVPDAQTNGWVAPGRWCADAFDLQVTTGTLARPEEELRAMLTHELGHLRLGHAIDSVTPSPSRRSGAGPDR
jgi:Zn-dependent protease with chaperone function